MRRLTARLDLATRMFWRATGRPIDLQTTERWLAVNRPGVSGDFGVFRVWRSRVSGLHATVSLLHAFERGINFVDTAEYCGEGRSEETERRCDAGTATKCTWRPRFAPSSGRCWVVDNIELSDRPHRALANATELSTTPQTAAALERWAGKPDGICKRVEREDNGRIVAS